MCYIVTEVELKRWYKTNKKKKLDRQLSYFDNSHCTVGHFCAPVNVGNFHWVFLDVILRNKEFINGCVGIIDHMFQTEDEEEHEKNFDPVSKSSNYYAQMWAAKYFGIYNMDSTCVNPSQIYFGYDDMNVKEFKKDTFDNVQNVSTLDHSFNTNPKRGIQFDQFNCGIWVLMEMCNRKCGRIEPVGAKTVQQLKEYRLRLFTLMINLYKITQVDNANRWLFEWRQEKVLKNKALWKKVFLQSFETDFDYNLRWQQFNKSLVSDDDNVSSNKSAATDTTTNKRLLPNKNDMISGTNVGKRKRFRKIDIDEEKLLGTCKHYDKYNERILDGGKWTEIDNNFMNYAFFFKS